MFNTDLLWQAIDNDNLAIFEEAKKNGIDLNIFNNSKRSLLHYAIIWGKDRIVKFLLKNGVNYKTYDIDNVSPLQSALLKYGDQVLNLKNAELLIDHIDNDPVYINQNDTKYYPPLCLAILEKKFDLADKLIAKGADINYFDSRTNASPFVLIAHQGSEEGLEYILKNGADIKLVNEHKVQLINIAIKKKHPNIAIKLIEIGADPNVQCAEGHTAAHYAVMNNEIDILKSLIKAGANLNIEDSKGYTPLRVAVENGNTEMAQLLLSKGASVDCCKQNGYTLLGDAIERGHHDITEMLMENGATLPSGYSHKLCALFDKMSASPYFANYLSKILKKDLEKLLFEAVQDEKLPQVQLLLKVGASAKTTLPEHYSVLHEACSHKNIPIIQALLKGGASFCDPAESGFHEFYQPYLYLEPMGSCDPYRSAHILEYI
jgi:ankyrin repeat protein